MNTGMLRDLNLKAGDKVKCHWVPSEATRTYSRIGDTTEVILVDDVLRVYGIPIQDCTATWEVVSRANPSPVREVVKKEIVSGQYGEVYIGYHSMAKEVYLEVTSGKYTKQELLEIIATLQTIADAMEHKEC